MKIGFDAKRAFFNNTGLGNYSRNIISYLNEYFPENQYYLFSPQKAVKSQTEKNNYRIYPQTFISKLVPSLWRTNFIFKEINTNKLDIYHGLSNEIPSSINKTSSKSVVTIHDLIFLRYPELYKPFDRLIYRKKALYSCRKADKIVAVSNQTKKDIIEFLKIDAEKIEVVYQGCNQLYYQKFDNADKVNIRKKFNLPETFILNVGTVEARKNIFSVIKAIHLKNIELPLVVVGHKTKYFEEIQKYIEKNNLHKKIIFVDKIDLKDLAVIYQMAEIFIYPSIFEGFGIPIIEALNSGIPVITTKGGCFSEAGGSYSVYINSTDIDEIKDAVEFILNNKDQKKKMIEKGFEYVKKFHKKEIANNMMNVYKSIV